MRTKKKGKNNNKIPITEEIYKELAKLNKIGINLLQIDIDLTRKQLEFWEDIRNKLYKDEPFKLFKKAHKKWENRVKSIDKKIAELYEELGVEIDDLNELLTTKYKRKY